MEDDLLLAGDLNWKQGTAVANAEEGNEMTIWHMGIGDKLVIALRFVLPGVNR
jgi:hypothetical protein